MSNNIIFGSKSYQVSYIQAFLRENYSTNVLSTGVYDEQTHEALINYLNLPNVELMNTVERTMLDEYFELSTMFQLRRQNDKLVFISKRIDEQTSQFIDYYINDIRTKVQSMGWEIENYNSYVDYNYDINNDRAIDIIDQQLVRTHIEKGAGLTPEQIEKADINMDGIVSLEDYNLLTDYIQNQKLYISIKACNRKNFFPNKDMLNFINLFSNDFLFYKAIRSDEGPGTDDIIHTDSTGKYKVCFIKCKPNQTYTIAHSSIKNQRLVIGCLNSTKRTMETVKVTNILDTVVKSEEPVVYTTCNDVIYLVIQCSSNIEDYTGLEEKVENIQCGNINFDKYEDGTEKIDNLDRKLLADYIFYPEYDSRRPAFTERQLIAADINRDGKIDSDDLQMLVDYLEGRIVSLPVIDHKYYVPKNINEKNNVASLLVMEGNQISVPTGETKEAETNIKHDRVITTLNIVIDTFVKSDFPTCNINIDHTSSTTYDSEEYKASFTRIEGNCERQSGTPTFTSPKNIATVMDLAISINGGQAQISDLSKFKLCKINSLTDYMYQSQGNYIVHKAIGEKFSNTMEWRRIPTMVSGKYCLTTVHSTIFAPTISTTSVPNILCNKLSTVSMNDLMNCNCPDYSISIDANGKLLVYVKNLDSMQENDMLYWLSENLFYLYGELLTPYDSKLSDEIKDIELRRGTNTLDISTTISSGILPTKIIIKSLALGITEAYIETRKVLFTVEKSTIGVNFESFTKDPWIVHHKFISYLIGQSITPYSRSEDITYVQNLLVDVYPTHAKSFIPGEYSDLLRELIENYQRTKIYYGLGDVNKDKRIDKTDIQIVKQIILDESRGIVVDKNLSDLADVDRDNKVTTNDLNMIIKETEGINDDLKKFTIEFLMGYLDPTTEYLMQKDAKNKLGKYHREIGW